MEAAPSSAADLPKEAKVQKVWELYKQFCHQLGEKELEIKRNYYGDNNLQLNSYYDSAWGTCSDHIEKLESEMKRGDQYPTVLNDLDIDLPLNEIEEIFNKYGVIQLRKIDNHSKKILLGCGNYPLEDFYRERGHYHKDMTTIDPELIKNPTIVAAFGINDLEGVLPQHQYDTLAFEFFGQLKKTDELIKALNGSYFTGNLDHYYHTVETPCKGIRGSLRRDIDGFDILSRHNKEGFFLKKGLPDTEDRTSSTSSSSSGD